MDRQTSTLIDRSKEVIAGCVYTDEEMGKEWSSTSSGIGVAEE